MAAERPTIELPALRVFPAPDGVVRQEPRAPGTVSSSSGRIRGVGWVLRWAAAAAVLTATAAVLIGFFFTLAAERSLADAAQAGIDEAALPRATGGSVERIIRHELAGRPFSGAQTQVWLRRNDTPLRGVIGPRAGDRLSVTLTLPTWAALPSWLRAVYPCQSLPPIMVRMERVVEGV